MAGAQRHWEEHASVSSTAKHPNPPQTGQILRSSQSFHAFPQGKSEAACLAGCQPPGKDAVGPAGLLRGAAAHSPLPREQEGSAEEAVGDTTQDHEENPCSKPSENVEAQCYQSSLVS